MTALVLHIVRKDLREQAGWILPYLAVVVARALLIGSGVDRLVSDPARLAPLGYAYAALMITHVGLLVVLTVQVVHADKLVGTTTFWVTRPVPPGGLLAAKLVTLVGVLVIAPVAVDALVVLGNGLPALEAAAAAADGALLRLAVVLPMAVLASVSSDLARFVVPAVGTLLGIFLVEAAVARLGLVAKSSQAANNSIYVFTALALIAGSLAAFAHQVLTRRTARTVLIAVLAVVGVLLVANRWTTIVFAPPRSLEAGWMDPGKVRITLSPSVQEKRSRMSEWNADTAGWVVSAAYGLTGVPSNIAAGPTAVTARLVFPDGSRDVSRLTARQSPFVRTLAGVEAAILGRLAGAPLRPEDMRVERLMPLGTLSDEGRQALAQSGARVDIDATLDAIGYRTGAVLPLRERGKGAAGDVRISLESAACRESKCAVVVREVRADFLVDVRRASRVQYVLVNQARHVALRFNSIDYVSRFVLGAASFAMLGEHLVISRRTLVFDTPEFEPPLMDASWERDATLVAIEVRDIGEFDVKAAVTLPPDSGKTAGRGN